MRRRSLVTVSLFAALALTAPVRADALRVQVELEGRLRVTDGGFVLDVQGEEPWAVEPVGFAEEVRKMVRARPNNKVLVVGAVQVRSAGGLTLQLVRRRVERARIEPMLPAVRVTRTVPGSPAAAVLKPGDMILEVNSQEAGSYEQFGDLLRRYRGRQVTLAFNRGGVPDVTRAVLNNSGPALGVWGETVWVPASQPMAMEVPRPDRQAPAPRERKP
jgi:hypothetical protein